MKPLAPLQDVHVTQVLESWVVSYNLNMPSLQFIPSGVFWVSKPKPVKFAPPIKRRIGAIVWLPSKSLKVTSLGCSQDLTACLCSVLPQSANTFENIIPAHYYYSGDGWGDLRSILNQESPLSRDLLALILSMHPHQASDMTTYLRDALKGKTFQASRSASTLNGLEDRFNDAVLDCAGEVSRFPLYQSMPDSYRQHYLTLSLLLQGI